MYTSNRQVYGWMDNMGMKRIFIIIMEWGLGLPTALFHSGEPMSHVF